MALDSADFVAEFPEFGSALTAVPAMVTSALAVGEAACGIEFWGDHLKTAQYLVAADMLALSPYGENLRMKDQTKSIYRWRYEQLRRVRPMHFAVSGGFGTGF